MLKNYQMRPYSHSSSLVLIVLLLLPAPAWAQQVALTGGMEGGRSTSAFRAEIPPEIDGLADDAVWGEAPRVGDFVQVQPTEGAAPSQPTEFQVAYDETNLYFFVRAHESASDSITHAVSRRDESPPSDLIGLLIDSYHDRRTGFLFAVNVDGVKRDEAIYDDGGYYDRSWDGVWDVATKVDAQGWNAEFRIPLSQLRYPDTPEHTFGFLVMRRIERHLEMVSWPSFRRDIPGEVSQFGTLTGLVGLENVRATEIVPYLVAKSETRPLDAGGFGRENGFDVGVDLKLRLTPNVTIDATVNPDFGQVEADPAVLNLTAFETFQNERRPFFVEGTGLYRFQVNCSVVSCSSEGLFYSRRIGRSPSLGGMYGDTSTPGSTPIAAAAKLTGQTNGGFSFGALNAVTREVSGADDATAEPLTNYAVLTAEQNFREGDTGIRVLATGVNRSLDEWTEPHLHSSAYAGAVSFRNRFAGDSYEVSGFLAGSRISGSAEAIASTQESPVHYYQQPRDDLVYDPERTTLSGHAAQVKVGKRGGGITRFETSFTQHSAGFELNDLGFLNRADRRKWATWAALNFTEPTAAYLWLDLNGNYWRAWNTSGDLIENGLNFNGHMGLHNNWNVHAGFTAERLGGTVCDRCSRGGPVVGESSKFAPWFGVNGDNRRMVSPSFWFNASFDDEGRGRWFAIEPSLHLRFSTRLDASVGPDFVFNRDDSQWVTNHTDDGGTPHHIFAHLDQRTVAANLRVNYTVNPNLTIQFYGQPFVSSGEYTDFRELSDTSRAERFADRYTSYTPPPTVDEGFQFRELNTNLVVRWEYAPGSRLFLAWAHGRRAFEGGRPGELSFRNEFQDLFSLHPDNTFMIKVSHWLTW